MIRNNTAVYIHYSAWDSANNAPKSGDVENHTLKLIIDGALSAPTNTTEEIAAGGYRLLLTAAETNGAKFICVAGVSSTADIYIIPAMVITDLLISAAAFIGCYTAWDAATNAPKSGDDANHTLTIAQDATSAGATNAPAEVDAVNVPGLYKVSVTTGEATGKAVSIIGVSATADINIMPTELAPFTVDYPPITDVLLDIDYAEGTLTGTLNRYAVITDPADPMRTRIMDTLEARLATITTANGYKTEMGAHISRWRDTERKPITVAELPACNFADEADAPTQESHGPSSVIHAISVIFNLFADSEANVRLAWADLEQALGADTGLSTLADDISLAINVTDAAQMNEKTWFIEVTHIIYYTTGRHNAYE